MYSTARLFSAIMIASSILVTAAPVDGDAQSPQLERRAAGVTVSVADGVQDATIVDLGRGDTPAPLNLCLWPCAPSTTCACTYTPPVQGCSSLGCVVLPILE